MRKRYVLILLLFLCLPVWAEQETPPAPATPRPVHLPQPTEKTLQNGLRVIVIPLSNMPLVTASMSILNGSEVDPPEQSGLADLTASLLTKGTKTKSAPEIADAIESLGGSLDSGADWDESFVSTNVMSSKLEPALSILADVVRNPSFQQEELERLRKQNLDGLSVTLKQPGSVARLVAARLIFGNDPYGHPAEGTPESLMRIRREDAVRLHATYYRPDNAILVFGGKMKPETAFQIAEHFFGDWQKPSSPVPAIKNVNQTKWSAPSRIVVIDMHEAGQAAVVLGRVAIRRKDPLYFPALVANSVLGGGYSARLNQEIRIKRGLSYGASSFIDARRFPGSFLASTQTKNQTAAEVASLLQTELSKLASEPVSETELTPRKANLIGSFGRALETTTGVVDAISSLALYGIDLKEINEYVQKVQSVKSSEIQDFAATRLNPTDAVVVVAGSGKDFLQSLQKKFPEAIVIPWDKLDLNDVYLRKRRKG